MTPIITLRPAIIDSSTDPNAPRPHRDKEFEDAHYHDEELEIQQDDSSDTQPRRSPARRKSNRRQPPRRWYED